MKNGAHFLKKGLLTKLSVSSRDSIVLVNVIGWEELYKTSLRGELFGPVSATKKLEWQLVWQQASWM